MKQYNYKQYGFSFLIFVFTLFLNGCHLFSQEKQAEIVSANSHPTIELPPKIAVSVDWNEILKPLVDELVANNEYSSDNSILVSDIKNVSNQYISPNQINRTLVNLLKHQDNFLVIDKSTINQAKQVLGIPYDDGLVSRSKMIALARQIGANYMLFTMIRQPPTQTNAANVEMELLSVKTGEIIWQSSSNQMVTEQSN